MFIDLITDWIYSAEKKLKRVADTNLFVTNINLIDMSANVIYMVVEQNQTCAPQYLFVMFGDYLSLQRLHPSLADKDEKAMEREFPPPKWFEDLEDIMFDNNIEVSVATEHIFQNSINKKRVEQALQLPHHKQAPQSQAWFNDEWKRQQRAIKYNYRLPTPQYYDNQIQLLVPLYEEDYNGVRQVVLVAAVRRVQGADGKKMYQLATVLPPDWAYNNARLLGRIESNWLVNTLAQEEPDYYYYY